jgi:hypothetical protein
MIRRGEQFDDLPRWTFDVDEVSVCVYKVTAIHDQGLKKAVWIRAAVRAGHELLVPQSGHGIEAAGSQCGNVPSRAGNECKRRGG